jgi:hypothetical protein
MIRHLIRLPRSRMARVLHGALLAIAVCCVLTAPSAQERPARVALFIGNANYPDAGKPLTTPVNDARALAEAFRRLDFDTTVKENLGKQDLRGTIDAFVSSVRPGSLALIYFAGYGLQAGSQTYLMPVDANIWSEPDIQREALSLENVVAQLHERGARSKVVIIDAAYRNPFERRFRNVPAGLATFGGPVGTLAIYSSAPGTRVAEPTGASSAFANELLKGLGTGDRLAETIFNETRTTVSRATKGEQIPWVASSLTEELRFARAAQPEPAQPAPATPPAAATPAAPPAAAAKAAPTPAPAPPATPPAAVAPPATTASPVPATPAAPASPPAALAKSAPPAAKGLPPGPGALPATPAAPAPSPAPLAKAAPPGVKPLPPGPGAVSAPPAAAPEPASPPAEQPPAQAPQTAATTSEPEATDKSLSAREVLQKHNLLGVFAWDCARPPSDRNWYTMRRPVQGDRVEQSIVANPGRPAVTIFDKASETAEDTIAVSGTRGKKAVASSWKLDGRRVREVEATADGQPEIADATWVRDGRAVAWSRKCSP